MIVIINTNVFRRFMHKHLSFYANLLTFVLDLEIGILMRIALFVLIFLIGVCTVYFMNDGKSKPLPILNPTDLKKEMVDSTLLRKGFGHTIGNFAFIDQTGEEISLKSVKGKMFVVEYFFTTCGSICPIMNQQMQRVQEKYISRKDLAILSFTVDPETDTLLQMQKHAKYLGAKSGFWHLLTGNKEELYALARKSFFVLKPAETVNQGDANSDFIHTNNFVLIDKQLRIRGYYDGTSKKEVDKLIRDIAILGEE
jgi:protein SCO1/2